MSTGLYLHVPFCARKCAYCDFYSLPYDDAAAQRYLEALGRAMRARGALNADTVYLGGGTPSLLGAEKLGALLELAARHLGVDGGAEITLEVNPGTVDAALLRSVRQAGYNRLSLGVQSLEDAELRALGRLHTAAEAVEAIELAAEAGFRHISADLMLGIPFQTLDSLNRSIEHLAALPVDHISAYLLKIEPGTAFGDREPDGLPDEETAEALYLRCVEALEAAGFAQYEVSNFARPGGESRHNLGYWRGGEYLGLGPAAHSFLGGVRYSFDRDLRAFLDAPDPLALMREEGRGGGADELVMLRLRLREGLDLGALRGAHGVETEPLLRLARRYEGHRLCRVEGEVVSLTPRGFLVSNSLISGFLAAMD